MKWKAIVFDLGGVLLDSEEAHESAARRIVAICRLAVPDVYWHRIRGVAYEDFFAYVLALPANRSIRTPAVGRHTLPCLCFRRCLAVDVFC